MKNNSWQQKTPLLTGTSIEQKRAELKNYYKNTWQTYESLFALINKDEAFFQRPEPLRHPLIFYFGHTATFFINKLILGKYIHQRINPKLEAICAVGVDEMSWDDLDSTHYDWPSVNEVKEYRNQVFTLVNEMIDKMALTLPIKQDSLAWLILMGCEHERIHLETSSVIMRMLPLEDLTASSEYWQACEESGVAPVNELLAVEQQSICLGKKVQDQTYGWDNEYGTQETDVDAFSASKYLVSNGEYMAFVEADGYKNGSWWCEEGSAWRTYSKALMPRFWFKKGEQYFQRNLLSEISLPLDWPVEVNYLEAKAFCNWKAAQTGTFIRLPTEAEWYCLRNKVAGDSPAWGKAPGNVNLEYYASSCPVNRFENNGFYDICGNVWQWTESAIDGFDGFDVHPLYDDFSTPTFDGKHNLIKGSSWISTGNESIASSRYAFRRHFFQHAGFRYIESQYQEIPCKPVSHYESDPAICQLLRDDYGLQSDAMTPVTSLLFDKLISCIEINNITTKRVLNVGCGGGRLAFEMSRTAEHIDALDFSAATIQHAVKLQQGEKLRFLAPIEGDIVRYEETTLALQFDALDATNVLFSQGDITNLKPVFDNYDVIVVQQALERCYDPKKALQLLLSRLNKDGLIVVVGDYHFQEQYTPREKWLGGVKVNGENFTGFDAITEVLAAECDCVQRCELPKQQMLTARKMLTSMLDVSFWIKG
jgi:5-histidylcysteine sulfoxide synthase/putative 4-mercaptohistidine N1-methyltranferase